MSDIFSSSMPVFGNNIGDTIPVEKFIDLCGCVFCWKYRYTRNCAHCEKMFCDDHVESHLCFKEKPTQIAPALVGARAYTATVGVSAR